MKIVVPYGKNGALSAQISDDVKISFLEANDFKIGDENKNIKAAINTPINSKSVKDFLGDAKKVLVIVNDAARPTPTPKILEFIFDDLKHTHFNFIIATGAHKGPSPEEYLHIFGSYYEKIKDLIIVHDARDERNMVSLGKSANGTQMFVNKAGVQADKIIIISSVEPHYFAGYTGGRKSFFPGIAGYNTIEQNHKLALKKNGILILVAKCGCGIGGKAFADLLGSSKTPKDALETIKKGYVLGYHKAAKMAQISLWAQIWGVTDIPPAVISKLFIKPFSNLQTALDKALEEKGKNSSLLFLMDGGLTVPLIQ